MAKKNKKTPSTNKQLSKLIQDMKPHLTFLVICLAVFIVGLWAYHVAQMIYVSRDEAAYMQNLTETSSPVFDQKVIDKLQSMRGSGVESPGTNYQHDRTNPFAE